VSKKKILIPLALTVFIALLSVLAVPSGLANADTLTFMETMVPMRDGTHLYTRIYLPGSGQYPVILTRSPYGIGTPGDAPDSSDPSQWPGQVLNGYAYVTQDTRGRYASEGIDRLFYDDGPDGYDCIDWISMQPWCNGKIGITGGSATGITTYLAAGENHPNLVAAYSIVASANLYNDLTFDGGAYRLDSMIWSYGQTLNGLSQSHLLTVVPPPQWGTIPAHFGNIYGNFIDMVSHTSILYPNRAVDSDHWMALPLVGGDTSFSLLQPFGDEILSNPTENAFRNKLNVQDDIEIPILHVAGWYDFFSRCTVDAFVALQNQGNQKLFVAPGTHGGLGALPYDPFYDWFDYWLKGEDTGIMDEPSVAYYVHGVDEWKWADQWPIEDLDYTNYYLHCNNYLSTGMNWFWEGSDSYFYDPMDPVLTWGGRNLGLPAGKFDQRPVEEGRDDILIYTGDPLPEDLEIAGPIRATLTVSSNCTDTDFTVKLIDVHPDGSAMLVIDNIIRARYRESMSNPVLMVPGEKYEIEFTLGDISHVFKEGHRIQVDISSSNFPKHDRNLNSGGELYTETEDAIKVAHNTIYHDFYLKSFITLPVVSPRPNVHEGTLDIETCGLSYHGPAELHIYDEAIYLLFDGTWIKFDIYYSGENSFMEMYKGMGDCGRLKVFIYHSRSSTYVAADGYNIRFRN